MAVAALKATTTTTTTITTAFPGVVVVVAPPPDPVRIHAPTGGCVGQLPVLHPGTAFEYHSASTSSGTGRMQGCLHFITCPPDTPSAVTGMPIPALDQDAAVDNARFEVAVAPFPLSSES